MPTLTKLEQVKLLLGITSNTKDNLLNLLLDEAESFALDYTHQASIGDSIIVQICIYRYNMLGNEGLNSESYSGMSFNYSQDLPQAIYKELNALRKVSFL